MPQDRPPYSKVVFISYSNSVSDSSVNESERDVKPADLARFIYQRLKYAHLPVRTYGADEAIGGGGFDYNSVENSSPLIAVVAGNFLSNDLTLALYKGKEIFIALFDQTGVPPEIANCPIFNFQRTSLWEESFQHMKAILMEREYPPPSGFLRTPDGDGALKLARSQHDGGGGFVNYFYMNVFDDIYNKAAKQQAIRDLGHHRILGGLIAAVLKDDPHEEVRAEAALALAKFGGYDFGHFIYEAARLNYPERVKVYAEIAKLYGSDPAIVNQLISDLHDVFVNDQGNVVQSPQNNVLLSESSDDQHQIFISYARKDCETIAFDLADRLQKKGFTFWIDTKLEPGTPVWQRAIKDAIRETQIVIVLLSPAVHESRWVQEEIACATELGKEIIPLMSIRTERPFGLMNVQGLRGNPVWSENPDQVFDLLVDSLSRKGLNLFD